MHSSSSSLNSAVGVLSSSRAGQRRKNVKKGHQFTLMVVGASGLGRSTFVNTLCGQTILSRKEFSDSQNPAVEETLSIQPTSVELEEEGLKLSLTVIDTPGFGDALDNESSFQEILHYIEKQYDDLVAEESRIKRNPKNFDNRVHALLYFIAPTGHALRELDIELMKRLAPRVNIIPVIGKADSLTTLEMADFKKRIMEDIAYYGIPIYDFPFDEEEDDEETVEENLQLRALLPFSIIGSEGEYNVSGRKLRGRKYPWGVVEVDNAKHCDFVHLRDILLSTHLNDLKDLTHDVLYENYRTEKLSRAGEVTGDDLDDSQRVREEQLRREEVKLREKELAISKEMLEKRQELLAKEASLRSLEMKLAQSQDNMA